MTPKEIFVDGLAREFVPYQGWKVVNNDSDLVTDPFLVDPVEPFKQIPDPLSHGKWHTLTNLVNEEGAKLLPHGIRTITFFAEGNYLLYDDNEDELLNRGDVKGEFMEKDFLSSRMNVLRSDGTLMSDDWFDEVTPCGNSLFIVTRGDDETVVDLNGTIQDKHLCHQDGSKMLKLGFEYRYDNGRIAIFNPFGDKVTDQGQSIMWASIGIWCVNLYCRGKEITFWHSQDRDIIIYSHELLIKDDSIALVELDGMWHLLSYNGQLTKVFKWTCSSQLDSQIKTLESSIPDGSISFKEKIRRVIKKQLS